MKKSFEVLGKFKYMLTTLTSKLHARKLKSRLNFGNASYHSVQGLQSSCLFSRNVNVKIYKTITLPVVLYGIEIWSLTSSEEHRLRVFENRILRRIFGPKRDEKRETGESCTMGSFIICTHHRVLLGRSNEGD
jgi:hypothetical protein